MKNHTKTIAALFAATTLLVPVAVRADHDNDNGDFHGPPPSTLPEKQIEAILRVQGEEDNGTLHFDIERKDIPSTNGPAGSGLVFTPSFELSGDTFFQPLGHGQAFMNGDMCVKEEEIQRFISALQKHGIKFQAFHQHLPMHPQVWFIHYRGLGDPIALATGVRAALDQTSTPFPQTQPSNPTTPLDANKLAQILDGDASVGDDGVVTVWVLRTDRIMIDGIQVNPQANVSTNIEFKPIGGNNAQVVSDFSMNSYETNPVINLMLNHFGWIQGCLYNQETNERPQLFFDHMGKTGDAYQLAREIRQGLNLTRCEGSPLENQNDPEEGQHNDPWPSPSPHK